MSSQPLPDLSAADQDFARIWGESTARILEQLHGSPVAPTPRSPAAAEATAGDTLSARFKAAGYPEGEFEFQFLRSDGVRMAQLLMSEPMDATAAFNETHADGVREIFRQFAGQAATACKAAYGRDVQFTLQDDKQPEWQPSARAFWVFTGPKLEPIQWTLSMSAELHDSLAAGAGTSQAQAQPDATAETAADASSPTDALERDVAGAAPPANLDLLLDVELEASLRFGQREMLLRDILELQPGSVVELDRRVQEPAELIVSGRVIAHGEVVIVDGNYGLRITDIAQPNQRLHSLET